MNRRRDTGLVLPLVLVVVVVLGAVVAAIATYATTTIRYGQVVERSADRLAAANGAMDNALEALDRRTSLCALTTLANGDGYEYDLLQPSAPVNAINGVNPTVHCRSLGGAVTGVEEFALVLTGDPGDGTRDGALLNIAGSMSERKVIDGPVFMAQRPNRSDTVALGAPLTIQDGDLWYGSTACPASGIQVPLAPIDPNPNVLITPLGYGIRCIATPDWESLFAAARPPESGISGLPTNPAPSVDSAGCTVFSPGRYTAAVPLSRYNYFRSGNYYFENIGEAVLTNAYALFGWPGAAGPDIQGAGNDTLADNDCRGAWESDADRSGATIYLGGNSRIVVGANGSLEVSGRLQGGRLVSVHALESTGVRSTIHGDAALDGPLRRRLIRIGSGDRKQIALQGLLWAPYASVQLDNVANDSVAMLRGGAVVSEIFLQASNATNFLVTRGSTPSDRRIELTATAASSDGGSTSVRAVVLYRDGEYALESRRVMCITPSEPDPAGC